VTLIGCILILLGFSFTVMAQTPSLQLVEVTSHLDNAQSMSITPSEKIYIAESGKHRLLVVSADGVRTDSLGARGGGDYRFNQPTSVDATNGLRIYVADLQNERVQLYDRRFQFLSTISADKLVNSRRLSPTQIQVSSAGDLYIYDSKRHYIYMFDQLGNFTRELNLTLFNVGSTVDIDVAGSRLLVLDQDIGVIHRFTADGGYLNFIGGFQNVQKIFGTENRIWALGVQELREMDERGNPIRTYDVSYSVPSHDLGIFENRAYILTSTQLLSGELK
jgi:hypothetical protein